MLAQAALALAALALLTATLALGLAAGAHRRLSSWGRHVRRRRALALARRYAETS